MRVSKHHVGKLKVNGDSRGSQKTLKREERVEPSQESRVRKIKVAACDQKDWDQHIALLLLSYRSAMHESTQYTLARVVFGRELRLPCNFEFGVPPDQPQVVAEFMSQFRENLDNTHMFRSHLRITSSRVIMRYDVRTIEIGFQTDNSV